VSTKCQKVNPNLIKKKLRFVKTVFRIIFGFLDERISTITHKKIEKTTPTQKSIFTEIPFEKNRSNLWVKLKNDGHSEWGEKKFFIRKILCRSFVFPPPSTIFNEKKDEYEKWRNIRYWQYSYWYQLFGVKWDKMVWIVT
jgi:hypothetical protein